MKASHHLWSSTTVKVDAPRSKVKPITPAEASAIDSEVPDEVVLAVNKLLISHSQRSGYGLIKLYRQEIVKEAMRLMNEAGASVTPMDFYQSHWLNFQPLFEKAGWVIEYENKDDKPFFTFGKV